MNFKLQLVACLSEGAEPVIEEVFTWNRADLNLGEHQKVWGNRRYQVDNPYRRKPCR